MQALLCAVLGSHSVASCGGLASFSHQGHMLGHDHRTQHIPAPLAEVHHGEVCKGPLPRESGKLLIEMDHRAFS